MAAMSQIRGFLPAVLAAGAGESETGGNELGLDGAARVQASNTGTHPSRLVLSREFRPRQAAARPGGAMIAEKLLATPPAC
jgi:hypothetical protein